VFFPLWLSISTSPGWIRCSEGAESLPLLSSDTKRKQWRAHERLYIMTSSKCKTKPSKFGGGGSKSKHVCEGGVKWGL
jgi:hypothetical protein